METHRDRERVGERERGREREQNGRRQADRQKDRQTGKRGEERESERETARHSPILLDVTTLLQANPETASIRVEWTRLMFVNTIAHIIHDHFPQVQTVCVCVCIRVRRVYVRVCVRL